jgi:hypothetical protein
MYEFRINFENRTGWGDHYTVWWWTQSDYVTVIDKIYCGYGRKEVLKMIKDEIRERFHCKRAKWEIRYA